MLTKATTCASAARAAVKPAVFAPASAQRSLLAATASALLLSLAPAPADARLPPEFYSNANNKQANASKNVESYQAALSSRGVEAPKLNSSGEQSLAGFSYADLTRAAAAPLERKQLNTGNAALGN